MKLWFGFLALFASEIIRDAAAFVIQQGRQTTTRRAPSEHRATQKRPVIVVAGDTEAAQAATLGAFLGLCIRDVLLQQQDTTSEAISVAQPVRVLAPSANELQEVLKDVCDSPPISSSNNEYPTKEDYEYILQSYDQENEKPIMHVILDAPDSALLMPQICDSISFLGMQPTVTQKDGDGKVPSGTAQQIGSVLQQILEFHGKASVAWDWPLHLAMLKANCLPKASSHGDSFLILPETDTSSPMINDGVVVVDYLYDFDNPFGGSDPLACPTQEVRIFAQYEKKWTKASNYAASAAYTACRGNGMDAVNAACIASSVGMTVTSEQPYTFERTAQLCQQLRDDARQEPVVRKKYIEFGYK